jgi:hypothetical protein
MSVELAEQQILVLSQFPEEEVGNTYKILQLELIDIFALF